MLNDILHNLFACVSLQFRRLGEVHYLEDCFFSELAFSLANLVRMSEYCLTPIVVYYFKLGSLNHLRYCA